jgi:hypothetical protein
MRLREGEQVSTLARVVEQNGGVVPDEAPDAEPPPEPEPAG